MMKSIQSEEGDVFACNGEGQGVFALRNGVYQQWRGTSETPTFRSPQQLIAYLHRKGLVPAGERFSERAGW